MRGETGRKYRLSDSLLKSMTKFELASKTKPIITQEHTSTIGEMIKLRVLGKDWDNIIPHALPDVGLRRDEDEAPEVSKEISKLGLGKLYKREYLNKDKGFEVEEVHRIRLGTR